MSHSPEPIVDTRPLVDDHDGLRALRRLGALPLLRPAEGPPVPALVVASRPGEVEELADMDVAPLGDLTPLDEVAPAPPAPDEAPTGPVIRLADAAMVVEEGEGTVATVRITKPPLRIVPRVMDAPVPDPTEVEPVRAAPVVAEVSTPKVEAAEVSAPVEISLHAGAAGRVALFVRYHTLDRFRADWEAHLQWGACALTLPWALHFDVGQSIELVLQPPDADPVRVEGTVGSCVDSALTVDVMLPPDDYLRLDTLAARA